VHPDDRAITSQAIDKVKDAFGDMLDDRERYIIFNHYGLEGAESRTMADIGKSMGLSRERVRQIEVGALHRLREAV